MISSGLVKVFYTDGYYETSDIKTLVGVILNKSSNSVTIGLLEKQTILNWSHVIKHVIKIESIRNRDPSSFLKI